MDKLSLKNKDWKDFYLSDFFDFEKGNQNNMASLTTGTFFGLCQKDRQWL